MNALFYTLFFLCLIAFIVGLINPVWVGFRTRKRSSLIYGAATLVFLISASLTLPPADKQKAENNSKTETTASVPAKISTEDIE